MKPLALALLAFFALSCAGPAAADAAEVGEAAPDFTLKSLDGEEVVLSSYRGKTVVLEWFNPECPFVVRNHDAGGALAGQAARVSGDDLVWLAINSGAPGKQGHGVDKNKKAAEKWGMTHAVLVDESGEVGRAYGAKTTPHMYVIDAEGVLRYAGAIDNAPSGAPQGGEHRNYVDEALEDLKEGRSVRTPKTTAYGCSVKYGK